MNPYCISMFRLAGMVFCWLVIALQSGWAAEGGGARPSSDLPMRIGVLAYRGADHARAEWQGHADYLGSKLAPLRFEIVPLDLEEFRHAVADRTIDLAITNTGHFVELEVGGRLARIATLRVAGPNGPVDRFGGTAIARSDRKDLNGYADLHHKRLAAPSTTAFGGWQVHLREARLAGLDLRHDLAGVIETQTQDKVVAAVLSGEADAGFVRSDVIESMAASGTLDLARLKVLGERKTPGYPYRHSTQLYPHWPFAKLDHVSEDLGRELLIGLLTLPADHPAAKAAGIHGWSMPQNYQPVHELFVEFRLGPYANLPIDFGNLLSRYGIRLAVSGIALISVLVLLLWWAVRANRELRRSRDGLQLAAGVFRHAQEGIIITDAGANIIDVNGMFSTLTGYGRDEVLGRNPRLLASGEHPVEFYRDLWNSLDQQGSWRGELINRRKDGSRYIQQTSISAVKDAGGRVRNYVGLFGDITELKESQHKLEQMAYFDALTGLPNRRLLSDRLSQAIAQSSRSDHLLAICYLDLDGFKPINDVWGHAAGDALLIETAHRLTANVRAGDTVSRLGGDEFVVLLGNLAHFDECEIALERVRTALNKPFQLAEGEARISASMGVTLFPLDGSDPDMLLRHADQAMYQAKQAGRNRYALFDAEHDKISEMRRESIAGIQRAIAENQLQLLFQPKVNMRSGDVLGVEALIRWNHPERGVLVPAAFMPVVDFVGLHRQVGAWVIEAAFAQAEAWIAAGVKLQLSINIAAEQLQAADFPRQLATALAAHPSIAPERVELEILETTALEDVEMVARVMESCHAIGVRFAIDDFGTGYSSLTYLKQLQADTLKIDQSFIQGMLGDPGDLSIVDSIIGLAASFRRKVVAEGVETAAHGTLLLRLGCDVGQGFGIAPPLPAENVPDWIATWTPPAEWRQVAMWPRDDLPLLTVEIDHLRWVEALRRSLSASPGELATPPLDPGECRFGHWLNSLGRERYGDYAEFSELLTAHNRVHDLATGIEAEAHHDRAAARSRLAELDTRCADLLAALRHLRAAALHRLA